MTWTPYYRGDRDEDEVPAEPVRLPDPPPWRRTGAHVPFQAPDGLADAVNAALILRRPLLLTGSPGSGKSTVALSIAQELGLGRVLRWHVTSRSTLVDALYRYDALGRLYARQHRENASPERFLRLGPLGTALAATGQPRVLLIDEIDKSDIDLPSDLLDVLERGSFEIDVLKRHSVNEVRVRLDVAEGEDRAADATCPVVRGVVHRDPSQFPVIVLTSNGEREFPPPFLRRCVRFSMPDPDDEQLARVVAAHLGELAEDVRGAINELIGTFASRIERTGEVLATDQLLNAVYLVTRERAPEGRQRDALVEILTRDLSAP